MAGLIIPAPLFSPTVQGTSAELGKENRVKSIEGWLA